MEPAVTEPAILEPAVMEPGKSQSRRLLPGTTAKVVGLKSKPALNGCAAIVGAFDSEKGRYGIQVISPELNDYVTIALKPENLEQGMASWFPAADLISSEDYHISNVLLVMDALDSHPEYNSNIAVACITRYVQSLMMERPSPGLPAERVLLSVMNAMRTNARNEGAAPHLFSVAVLTLPFLLEGSSHAAMVDLADARLECSLLTLLLQGLGWYAHIPEILSSTMLALRQLLSCWVNADAKGGGGLDPAREKAVRSSGMLPTLVKMCERSKAEEGSMELLGHAFSAFTAVSGAAPSPSLAKALVSVGVVGLSLRIMGGISKAAAEEPKNGPPQTASRQLSATTAECLQAAAALLKALATTSLGRMSLRRAGGVDALVSSLPSIYRDELEALKRCLELAEEPATDEIAVDKLDLEDEVAPVAPVGLQ